MTTKTRVYATCTSLVAEALEHAPEALDLEDDAPIARRSTAWIEWAYKRWQEDQEEELKLRAYTEIAEDRERLEAIKRSSREAVEAGIW